jgi:hypothetical protein
MGVLGFRSINNRQHNLFVVIFQIFSHLFDNFKD